jgi:hypothetical protein
MIQDTERTFQTTMKAYKAADWDVEGLKRIEISKEYARIFPALANHSQE